MNVYRVDIVETTRRTIWVTACSEHQAEARATVGGLDRIRNKESYLGEDFQRTDRDVFIRKESDEKIIEKLWKEYE